MSTLNVDALVGNTSANAITVRGEGTATTSLQQGLAKSWLTMDGTGTVGIVDSFNIGGITDVSTGDYSHTYSSNLGTAEHPIAGSIIGSGDSNFHSFVTSTNQAQATTGDGFQVIHHASTSNDHDPVHIIVHGDLA
nr:hypothetical protein [uncultured Mediterranean phage uvMED]